MGSIFILVLVQIMNINNNEKMVVLKVVKSTQISVMAGGGERIFI
jgi:hypothetical protein